MTKIQRLEKRIAADDRVFQSIEKILDGLRSGAFGESSYPKAAGAIEAVLEGAEFSKPGKSCPMRSAGNA
jgi:hypothetical protein